MYIQTINQLFESKNKVEKQLKILESQYDELVKEQIKEVLDSYKKIMNFN